MTTEKSPEAFRTISEVADWLGTPTHVLRFWESRFREIKPVKRAGGRRYYRPADMELLGGIKKLLHEDGMTIRGVQKLLREQGVRRVADLSPPLALDGQPQPPAAPPQVPRSQDAVQAPSPDASGLPERPGPQWPAEAPLTPPPSAAAPVENFGEAAEEPADAHRHQAPPQPDQPSQGFAATDAPAHHSEAGMVENASGGADNSAEVVPFVLEAPLRPVGSDTPDLFGSPGPDRTGDEPEASPAPAGSGAPVLRLPAIPPDPDNTAPLSPSARPPLRGFRKPPGKPDDRLLLLFEKLSALRGRMDDR